MAGVEGERINAPGAVEQFSPGHAILIFFSSRRILRRKFFTVFLLLGLVRVWAELAVQLPPGDPLLVLERKGAVGQPEVKIETQGAAFEGVQGVHVDRDRPGLRSFHRHPLSPSHFIVSDRSSPSRVRFAASRPGLLRADPKDDCL